MNTSFGENGPRPLRLYPGEPAERHDLCRSDFDLVGRLHQHRIGAFSGFTSEYQVFRLVHFEMLADMEAAIAREKQLKDWRRAWKTALIEENNPTWEDLAIELGFEAVPAHPATRRPAHLRHPDESQDP